MRLSEAEQTFYEDIREKKKAATGVHHKTGKRGYVGTMRFPTDIMSRKDKYNHRKASKVMTSNLYEKIILMDEFIKLEKEEQKQRMLYWRTNFSNADIRKGMKIANATLYKIIDELQLPRAERKPRQQKTVVVKKQEKKSLLDLAQETLPTIQKKVPEAPPVQEVMVNGLHLIFNGTYTTEHIIKQLSKFELMLDGEPDQFYIELKITQKAKV